MESVRAIGAVVVFYSTVIAGTVLLFLAAPAAWLGVQGGLGVQAAAMVVAALAVYALLVWRGWADWSFLGWPGARRALVWFCGGTAFGLGMAGGALVLAMVAGSRASVAGGSMGSHVAAAVQVAILLLLAALAEELLFRGYPLRRLSVRFGKVPASVALAVLFASAHLLNPGATGLGMLNVALASLVLSAAFFTRGLLAAAWGLHFGWNAGLGLGVDAPVSGIRFELPGLEFSPGEPAWLTGGSFGPEGGVVASVVMIAALAFLTRNYTRLTEDQTE